MWSRERLWPELWIKLGRNAELKEKHKWSDEKPKLDNARRFSWTLRTRSSKKPLRMLARNWKRRWLLLCLPRQASNVSMVRPVAKPMRSNQNLRVSWKPVLPQDCVWKNLYRIIVRTILQERGDNSLQHYNLAHKNILLPQAMKIPAAKAAVDKEWEKLEKISAWNLTKSQK